MRQLIIFLLFTTLTFAQQSSSLLMEFSSANRPELNTNVVLDFAGTNTVSNGTFADATGWVLGTGASIALGVLNIGTGTSHLENVFASSKTFVYKFDYTHSSGITAIKYYNTGFVTIGTFTVSGLSTGCTVISGTPYIGRLYAVTTGAGIMDNLVAYEAIPPTGFVSPTMDESNYLADADGCKFIEATGTTYIEMEDTLVAGWYYVTATQNYTSGELNAYNGTSEVAFPQVSGTSKKLVQLDGVHPLRLQVDNNSNITVTKLSIKRK